MCGIAGIWRPGGGVDPQQLAATADRMGRRIARRGPDASAVWQEAANGVAFAHARLAIIDLTPTGAQPMSCPNGRYTICFNGEIYNYRELRHQLEKEGFAFAWRGTSDTEVILALVSRHGVVGALKRMEGMFAFALWDHAERTMTIARDRIGEKPLLYSLVQNRLSFASDMTAVEEGLDGSLPHDEDAVSAFLTVGYVPSPRSVLRGIRKLRPAHYAVLSEKELRQGSVEEVAYWTPPPPESLRVVTDEQQIVEEARTIIREAVARQLVADVPVGALLSGGIDSTTIVAMMREAGCRDINTFTVAFDDRAYDESAHARTIANHLGVNHHEILATPEKAVSVIQELPRIYGEPFADASQIPTVIVSEFARSKLKVVLSGDGGDEIFGGYNRYLVAGRIWPRVNALPAPLRSFIAGMLDVAAAPQTDRLLTGRLVPRSMRVGALAEKLAKLAGVMRAPGPRQLYELLVRQWPDANHLATSMPAPATHEALDRVPEVFWSTDLVRAMMRADLLTYLPDDILVKVDRASMHYGLECRPPFLDRRVVEFASSLPTSMALNQGTTKWVLRQVVSRYVPASMLERPKMGFGVPISEWLRGPLREWAESLLSEEALKSSGMLNVAHIRHAWSEHLARRKNLQYQLWNVLMWQQWHAARRR